MNDEINYKNNPLHGVSLKTVVEELTQYYGYDILYAYLNLNCFKSNPSVQSTVKFLKKTQWAQEKVESFYLYQYKSLPRASDEEFLMAPRDRIIPENQKTGEPVELSLEDAERLREKRARKAAERDGKSRGKGQRRGSGAYEKHASKGRSSSKPSGDDPWASWKK